MTIDRLERTGGTPTFLVCSYGTVSPDHELTAKLKDVGIDWQAGGNRTVLFDLHDTFIRCLRRDATVTGMEGAIEIAIAQSKGFLACCERLLRSHCPSRAGAWRSGTQV